VAENNRWISDEMEMQAIEEADRRRRSVASMARNITPQQVQQAQGLIERNPNLSAGLLQALLQGDVPDAQADALAQQDEGGWMGSIMDVAGDVIESVTDGGEWAMTRAYEYGIKPAVRGVVLASETLAQEVVQRPLTAGLATIQGEADSFGQAYDDYGDSAGVNLLQGDLATVDAQGNPIEDGVLGKGLFLGGSAQAETDSERKLQIRGQRADVGQALANGLVGSFYSPGDRAYDVTAGISGFAVDVFGDPLAWATGGATKAIKASRSLSVSGANEILAAAKVAGKEDELLGAARAASRTVDAGTLRPRGSVSTFAGRADDFTDTLFREVDVNDARAYVPGGMGDDASARELYFSSSRNLARGQGKSQGVVLEFDASAVQGQARANVSKPAWEAAWDAGEAEFTVLQAPSRMRDAVRSVTVKSDAAGAKGASSSLSQTLDELVDAGWERVDVEDGVKYVRPGRVADDAAFKDAGLIQGSRRNTLLMERGRDFFSNDRMLQRLADSDEYDIMQSWARSPANRIDLKTIVALGDAKDPASVIEVLLNAVGQGDVAQSGFYSGMGNFVKRSLNESTSKFAGPFRYFTAEGKLAGLAPTGSVSADTLASSAGKLDSLLRQANIPREFRASIFGRMARAEDGAFDELFDIVTDAIDEVALKVDGGADTSLNAIAKSYREELGQLREYGIESWGNAIDVPYAKRKMVQNFDGTTVEMVVPTPQALVELSDLSLHLPDITSIRRAATETALLRSVYTSKGWDFTASTAKSITHNVFKPLAILRPAYVVRIGAEEQARLAVEGYDSMWDHPLRFIMANLRNRDELSDLMGRELRDVAEEVGVITRDAHGFMADSAGSKGRMFTKVYRVEGEDLSTAYVTGWRGELGQIAASDDLRQMAFLRGNLDEFKTWAQGEGLPHIRRMARVNKDENKLLEFGDGFDDWARGQRTRVEAKTNWDEDLIDRIVNKDIPYPGPHKKAKNAELGFANFLRAKARDGVAPAAVKSEIKTPGRTKHLDNVLDTLFNNLTGKPTSYLARFPAFRQSMLRRTGELFDTLATDELREEAFALAVNNLGANTGKVLRDTPQLRALREAFDASKGKVGGKIKSIEDLNRAVIQKSSEDVKDLLFDVTARGSAQEAMEVVVPFLDAWKEVSRTWARLGKENPAFFIRAQAGYRELEDNGFFHVNEHGKEVFNMPGGQYLSSFVSRLNEDDASFTEGGIGAGIGAVAGGAIASRLGPLGTKAGAAAGGAAGGAIGGLFGGTTQAAAGAAADVATGDTPAQAPQLEGRVEGINLVAQGIGPGFGPVVQWGAGVMPSAPELEGFRNFLAPFGTGLSEPDDVLSPGTIPETLLPAWMRKLFNAVTEGDIDERQWNSTVGDAVKALVASGEIAPNDPDLVEKSERYGRWLLLARSFGQATGPTGPSATLETELPDRNVKHEDWNPEIDPSGEMFGIGVLASDYYRLAQTYGPEDAAARFYDMYGAEPFFVAQSKTKSLAELPVSTEGGRWMRTNEGVVDDFPVVAGFFAPTDEDAELDFSVYSGQLARGQRESLTPAQQTAAAQQVRARSIYNTVKDRLEGLPTAQRDRALALTEARLEEVHPGWRAPVLGVGGTLRADDKIRELQRAVEDPRLADNPLTPTLSTYLRIRGMALAEAEARGYKTLESDKVADIRERLSAAGTAISQSDPVFMGVWSGLLSREVEDQ